MMGKGDWQKEWNDGDGLLFRMLISCWHCYAADNNSL